MNTARRSGLLVLIALALSVRSDAQTSGNPYVVTSCGGISYTASSSTVPRYAPFTIDVTGKACTG